MVTMKDAVPRRVWRMTSDSPAGEYLELVPKAAFAAGAEPRERAESSIATGPLVTMQRVGGLQSRAAAAVSAPQEACRDAPAPTRAKVLRPAQVENWQSSSFDLLSGLQVRDVSDTIPGRVFEELFRTLPATAFTKRRY
jgi:hypothetical protein